MRPELNRRPTVDGVPENVGQQEGERDGAAEPCLTGPEVASLRCEQQADHDAEAQKEHRHLGRQADAGDQPEDQPESWLTALQQQNEDVDRQRPP